MGLVRRSDNTIRVTITGADGNPVTISGLSDLEIVAYQKPRTIIQRWLMSDGDTVTVDDAGGIVDVYFDRENTQQLDFKTKECKLEVVATFSDSNFESNLRREVDTEIELSIVEDSPTAYEA